MKLNIEVMWPPQIDDLIYQDMGQIGGSILLVRSLIFPMWNDTDDCIMRCLIVSDMFILDAFDSPNANKTATGLTLHIGKSDLQQLNSKLYLIFRRLQ